MRSRYSLDMRPVEPSASYLLQKVVGMQCLLFSSDMSHSACVTVTDVNTFYHNFWTVQYTSLLYAQDETRHDNQLLLSIYDFVNLCFVLITLCLYYQQLQWTRSNSVLVVPITNADVAVSISFRCLKWEIFKKYPTFKINTSGKQVVSVRVEEYWAYWVCDYEAVYIFGLPALSKLQGSVIYMEIAAA
jgi:hypothetical protein